MNLKTFSILVLSLTLFTKQLEAQKTIDWQNIQKYAKQNEELIKSKSKIIAVFIGNSITEGWVSTDKDFFDSNNYVGRGIGGQITPQMLARFREDVINLKPKVVVINGGINDIAENMGVPYKHELTLGYIKSMADLAKANSIKVIITSVLPATNIPWNNKIEDVPAKVEKLNSDLKTFAKANKFTYVDYYSSLVDSNKGLKASYTSDGVHVTKEGYTIMNQLVKKAIYRLAK